MVIVFYFKFISNFKEYQSEYMQIDNLKNKNTTKISIFKINPYFCQCFT